MAGEEQKRHSGLYWEEGTYLMALSTTWTVWAVNAGESHEEAWQPRGSPSLVSWPEGMERLTRSLGAPRGRERGADKTRQGQW